MGWPLVRVELIIVAMAIYLDGQPIELAGSDVGAVLNAARAKLAESGRVIVEVEIDGNRLVDADLDEQQHTAVDGHDLRLTTADPGELAADTLAQVRTRLDDLRQIQADAAELFQQDKTGDAVQKVAQAMGIWQQAQQAVLHSAVLTQIELDDRTVDDQPVNDTINLLADQLRELRDALTNGDTVTAADALAFEWPDTIDRWQALVDQMIQWIEKG